MSWHPISTNNLIFNGTKNTSWEDLDCTTDTSAVATTVPAETNLVRLRVKNDGAGFASVYFRLSSDYDLQTQAHTVSLSAGETGFTEMLTTSAGAVQWYSDTSNAFDIHVLGYLDTTALYSQSVVSDDWSGPQNFNVDIDAEDSSGSLLAESALCFFRVDTRNNLLPTYRMSCGVIDLNDDQGDYTYISTTRYFGPGYLYHTSQNSWREALVSGCCDSGGNLKMEYRADGTVVA